MNRAAICIKMLQMLKSRGVVSTTELSNDLQVNQRNIREYRKELEHAGYVIEITTGKHGGYCLMNDCLLPSVQFSKEEIRALQEIQTYVKSHTDFLMLPELRHAIDKMLFDAPLNETHIGHYLDNESTILSPQMRKFIELCEQAIEEQQVIHLSYRTLKQREAQEIQIHPYEIINYKGAFYCVAYSLKAKDFRIYKFSEERMKDCQISDHRFIRDAEFDITKHIGESGLVKDELIEVELEIYEEAALLSAEKRIGLHPSHTWVDPTTLRYQTIFEGKQAALSFVLSLGGKAKILSPVSLQEALLEQIDAIKARYCA